MSTFTFQHGVSHPKRVIPKPKTSIMIANEAAEAAAAEAAKKKAESE